MDFTGVLNSDGEVRTVKTVGVAEAKNQIARLLREVEAGDEVVITRDNRPAAVLLSVAKYQEMKRRLSASGLRSLREELRGMGLDAAEIFKASRRQLEDRP
jgi:prevent-host-death family protein